MSNEGARRHHVAWTDDLDAKLRSLKSMKYGPRRIADALGGSFTFEDVIKRELELSLREKAEPCDRWSEQQKLDLIRMWTDGLQAKVIARRIGKAPTAIMKKRAALGLPGRPGGRKVEGATPFACIYVSLSTKERDKINNAAMVAGMSTSAWARAKLRNFI